MSREAWTRREVTEGQCCRGGREGGGCCLGVSGALRSHPKHRPWVHSSTIGKLRNLSFRGPLFHFQNPVLNSIFVISYFSLKKAFPHYEDFKDSQTRASPCHQLILNHFSPAATCQDCSPHLATASFPNHYFPHSLGSRHWSPDCLNTPGSGQGIRAFALAVPPSWNVSQLPSQVLTSLVLTQVVHSLWTSPWNLLLPSPCTHPHPLYHANFPRHLSSVYTLQNLVIYFFCPPYPPHTRTEVP